MGNNFKACFFSSAKLSKCLVMETSFLAAIEAIEPQENVEELLLFVSSDSNLLGLNVSMRFTRIASNLAGRAMDLLVKEGCPHGEVHVKVQSLFQDLCSGWITEESFELEKQGLVNLIKKWLVKGKEITGHVINGRQDPLWMLRDTIDLCFSSNLSEQIKGVQKYLEAIGYSNDWIDERTLAERQIIESVHDLFEPELGNCFDREED